MPTPTERQVFDPADFFFAERESYDAGLYAPTRGTLNLHGDQSFVVYGQASCVLSATDSAGLTRHSLSGSIRLQFYAAEGAALTLCHTDSPREQFPSLHDNQLGKLVNYACARIQDEFSRRAPFLGEQVRGWMAHLSPTGKAPEYFLQPRSFPLLHLLWWAAKSFTAEPDREFLADVVYSTVNGYYYIRLLDNLMDGHGTVELKILPATAFFHTEFQAMYHKYFDAAHPFWEVFRSAWFSASEAVTREVNLDRIHRAEFERVTVAKLAGVRIPLAAVGFRHGAGERLRCWEEFTLALARWSQMEDDLFDWHHDLRHGKTSYFLTEASRHKGFESIDAWVIREGFQQGMETLQRELSALRRLVPSLHSPDVVRYLDSREAILERQKVRIGEAFQILKDVASITEPRAQTSD